MNKLTINYLAVAVMTVVHQLTNFVWYSIIVQDWMRLTGITMEQAEQNQSAIPYLISLVAAGLACYMLAWLFTKLEVTTVTQGIVYAVSFYGCFLFFQVMTKDMFQFRPLQLTMLNEGINAINFALTGAVLAAWKKYTA